SFGHAPPTAVLPPAARLALFRQPFNGWTYASRLVGFYLADPAGGRVIPHGMHLFPAAMAIGYALAGLRAALLVPALLATIGIAGAALLARRLAGRLAGRLAAALLIVNPAESWFGRYPAAETMLQAALFAGLLCLAVALERRSTWLAAAAGAMVGLVHLAKIETFVLPIAVVAVAAWLW